MRSSKLVVLLVTSLVVLSSAEVILWLDPALRALLILVVPLLYFIISFLLFVIIDPKMNAPIPHLFTRGLGLCFSLKLASGIVGVMVSRIFTDYTTNLIQRLTTGAFLIIAMVAISLLIYQFWNKFRNKSNEDEDVILDQPIDS